MVGKVAEDDRAESSADKDEAVDIHLAAWEELVALDDGDHEGEAGCESKDNAVEGDKP